MNESILIVEDRMDNAEMIGHVLGYHQIVVTIVPTAEQALDVLQHLQPAAIIIDLHLPRMDGWSLLKRIRELEVAQSTVVVAITAYDDHGVDEEALKAGFDAYFAKPLQPIEFANALMEMVRAAQE
ncbi:MAG: response regulator [Chloroflexi bacterium]|nr:response regulator [Chloroflexota bacterium]